MYAAARDRIWSFDFTLARAAALGVLFLLGRGRRTTGVLCLADRRGKGLGKPGVSGSSSPSDDNSFVSAVAEILGRRGTSSEENELTVYVLLKS